MLQRVALGGFFVEAKRFFLVDSLDMFCNIGSLGIFIYSGVFFFGTYFGYLPGK